MPPDEHAADAARHLEDAEFAITQFSSWIVSADTKAGLLSAATALLIGGLIGERGNLAVAVRGHTGIDTAVLALLALTGVALVVTAGFLVGVLYPRKAPLPESRFAWPRHVAPSPPDMTRLVTEEHDQAVIATEAWLQATALASIAGSKFGAFKIALIAFAVSAASFLVLVGTSAFLPT